jgi:hypothetical protein
MHRSTSKEGKRAYTGAEADRARISCLHVGDGAMCVKWVRGVVLMHWLECV